MKSIRLTILSLLFLLAIIASPVSASISVHTPAAQDPIVSDEDQAWLDLAASAESFTVQLQAPSLVMYLSEAMAISEDGSPNDQLPLDSVEALAYLEQINAGLDNFIAEAQALLGRPLEVDYRYDYVLNGFSAEMSVEEAALLREQAEVKEIFPNTV